EIFPERQSNNGDYLLVTSSSPLYATEVIEMPAGRALAAAAPIAVPDSFKPSRTPALPTITQIGPGTDVRPGTKLSVSVTNWSGQGVFLLGDVALTASRLAAGFSVFTLVVPSIDPCFVNLRVPVPLEPDLTIRVVSRLRTGDLRVADNTSGNALYSITTDVDARQTIPKVVIADNSRLSGAFNILEMIQRSNDAVRLADVTVIPPPIAIFWSTRNTPRAGNIAQGLVGTTYFNYTDNTAFVLGDRNFDSDEFDDSVIIHEYAHMLAARFSRDDSPGGAHGVGDMLDP